MSDQRLLSAQEFHDIKHFRLGGVRPIPPAEMRDTAIKLLWHAEAQADLLKEACQIYVSTSNEGSAEHADG